MKITCTPETKLYDDIYATRVVISEIETALHNLQLAIKHKKLAEVKFEKLKEQRQECVNRLNSIINTRNLLNMEKFDLRQERERTKPFEFRKKLKIRKKLKYLREYKQNLREINQNTQKELEKCNLAIEKRKNSNAPQLIEKEIVLLVKALALTVQEYRRNRQYFYSSHGISLPKLELSDLISREGKNITVLDAPLPFIHVQPPTASEINTDASDNLEDIALIEL